MADPIEMWGWCDFTAGWISGLAGIVVGHPADTMKVRQQTLHHIGAIAIVKNTIRYEGFRGFFKGMMFPALSAGVVNSVFFGIYGNTLRFLQHFHGISDRRRTCAEGNYPIHKFWHLDVYLAGCIGGLSTVFVNCPVEVVKIKLQSQTGTAKAHWADHYEAGYKGPIDCAKHLYHSHGIKGFYRGFHCMVWRDVIASGIYMLAYVRSVEASSQPNHIATVLLAGGFAGTISWAVILPLDVVKSRLQADNPNSPTYKGIIDCAVKSYRSDGIDVFGRGFWLICLRAFAVNAAVFVGLEWSLDICQNMSDKMKKAKQLFELKS